MKGSRTVCLICRHRIATSSPTAIAQWQWQTHTASFSTTTRTSKSDDTHSAAAASPPPAASTDPKSASQQPSTNRIRRVLYNAHQSDPNVRLSNATPRNPSEETPARVDVLFQQIIQEQKSRGEPSGAAAPVNTAMDLQLVQAIGKLQDMITSGAPVADAYAYLKTEIYPTVQQPGVNIPQVFYRVVFRLMEKVAAAKKKDILTNDLPTLAEIFSVYADIGELNPQQWSMLVGELVQKIVDMGHSTEGHSIDGMEREHATREAMLVDLVESWKVLSLPRVDVTPADESEITDGFWFPRLDKFSLLRFSKKGNFPAAFANVFQQYKANQLGAAPATLAIATYALLLDSRRGIPAIRRSASRFLSKVAYLITFVHFRDHALQREVKTHFPRMEEYIMGQWPNVKAELSTRAHSHSVDTYRPNIQQPPGSSSTTQNSRGHSTTFIGHRLGQAYATRNSGEVDRLWQEFVGVEKVIPEERTVELRKHPELFDSFINTRMALNQPDQAIFVWNTLRQAGLKPTLRTWNLMLDGCKKAKNANGIKNIWAKLAASGTRLDTAIWTTRVSGLVESGDIPAGIQALEEMVKLWKGISKGKNNAAIKPTIEPVNAALAGLIRQNQVGAAEKLLAWAGRQGIDPDIFTFNTLLRPLIRDGTRDNDVRRLFKTMRDLDVRADAATFVLVLDASFSKVEPGDPVEQANLVAEALSEMEAVGLETNLQTYGKMVYLLLQSNATQAAKATLEHLWSHNLELSPHIYTMLVEYYFSRHPPDLEGVERLLEKRRLLDYDDVDRVFYERVIKGYAGIGNTDVALLVFNRLSERGVTVAIGTQTDLLRMLLKQSRWDDARTLVNATKRRYEEQHPEPGSENSKFWDHAFWHIAARYQLVDRTPKKTAAAV